MNKKEFKGKYESLEFIRDISWDEIFDIWRKNEAYQESWKKHWEERGYRSWEEWRENYVRPLNPENLKWSLFRINNPIGEFPSVWGVPSRGWIKNVYDGEITKQLKDVVNHSVVINNEKMMEIRNGFPKRTVLTGIFHDGKIVLIEGMHRACVLASWNKNKSFDSEVFIALAKWNKEISIIGSGEKNK